MNWLTFADDVTTSPSIERTVNLMQMFFDGEPSIVTSGLRTTAKQLQIIRQKAIRHGIETAFPEFDKYHEDSIEQKVKVDGRELFWWQRTWSMLLQLNDIVNPPVPAVALFDYIKPGTKENKKGKLIGLSPHQFGYAFDIGGGKNLNAKAKRVIEAFKSGQACIKSYLVEETNNAIHVDTVPLT